MPKGVYVHKSHSDAWCRNMSKKITELHNNGIYNYKHLIGNKFRLGKPGSKKLKGIRVSKKTEFKKGMIPWNKGLKYSSSKRGKKYPQYSGENHWNWRGGITPYVMKLRTSIETRIWREKIFERDNYICQNCGKKNCNLNAHHLNNFSEYPDLRFDLDNGITLCRECHLKIHRKRKIKLVVE